MTKINKFPFCELHSVRIVHALPKHCPLATEQPLAECHARVEAAMSRFCNPDDTTAHYDHIAAECCLECCMKQARHPVVVRLRRMKP